MLLKIKLIISFFFVILVIGNFYTFVNSIKLSDDINRFENKIIKLKQDNLILENKIYDIDSLRFASSMAAQLNFSITSEPIYLDNLKYALNL
jgi:hypothetical protein